MERVRFAADSPVEGDGFELLVPRHQFEKFLSEIAAKEAFEEAGVISYISANSIGMFRARKQSASGLAHKIIDVWVYLFEVTEPRRRWPEIEVIPLDQRADRRGGNDPWQTQGAHSGPCASGFCGYRNDSLPGVCSRCLSPRRRRQLQYGSANPYGLDRPLTSSGLARAGDPKAKRHLHRSAARAR